MNTTPKFHKNLWGDLQGNLNTSTWALVTQAWNDKQYLTSFYTLLDYINPAIRTTHGNQAQTEFNVPHGSVLVNITLKNDIMEVVCPMVDITSAIRIPLLRKAAELNFHPLSLAQMKVTSDQLSFYYSCTLDTCEPYKTYYVFKEICQTADRYDDEFCVKFKAKNIVEPRVTHVSAQQLETAWSLVNEIINETIAFVTYFDSQRWFSSSLDFFIIALKRIDLCVHIQGYLKNELEIAIGDLGNGNLSVTERNQIGRKFLQRIQQMERDAFAKNLYIAETFIPEKWRTNADQIKTAIKEALAQTQKYHTEKSYVASCIESLYCIYDLFYKNNMDNAVNDLLFESLEKASGKTWEESSGILLRGLQTIATTQF